MTIEIPLSKQGKHAGKYVAIVDDCDADLVVFSWSIGSKSSFYVRTHSKDVGRPYIFIHRIILARILGRELQKDELVDHANGNTLDNRRENLRLATHKQNMSNRKMHRNNVSGYKGIYWEASRGKYRATIRFSGKNVFIGRYNTPQEAHAAYCEKAKELYGEFARFE